MTAEGFLSANGSTTNAPSWSANTTTAPWKSPPARTPARSGDRPSRVELDTDGWRNEPAIGSKRVCARASPTRWTLPGRRRTYWPDDYLQGWEAAVEWLRELAAEQPAFDEDRDA